MTALVDDEPSQVVLDDEPSQVVLDDEPSQVVIDDEQLLRVMTVCDQYAQQQKLLAAKLGAGIFQLLQARKNGSVCVDDIRQDFDCCAYLMNNEETGFLELQDDGNNDALLMFSALPPPALRRAQKLFMESIKISLQLMSSINELELETH